MFLGGAETKTRLECFRVQVDAISYFSKKIVANRPQLILYRDIGKSFFIQGKGSSRDKRASRWRRYIRNAGVYMLRRSFIYASHCLWFFSRCRFISSCSFFPFIHVSFFMILFTCPPRDFDFLRCFIFQGTPLAPLPFTAVQGNLSTHSFIRYELILVINTLKIGIALTKWLPDWYW